MKTAKHNEKGAVMEIVANCKRPENGIELSWPGKPARVCGNPLPFYHMESVGNHCRDWRNMLIYGENRDIIISLLHGSMRENIEKAGGLKLIYADPPFSTGENFLMPSGAGSGAKKIVAWKDNLREYEFLNMLYERLLLMHELLAPDGCLYLHCDWRFNARARLMLDEIFGFYVNEIVWHYTGGGRAKKHFSRKHDTIFIYAKSKKFTFNGDCIRIPYKKESGYAQNGIISRKGKKYLPNPAGTVPDDVWDIPIINPLAKERTGYPTQKPQILLERILKVSTFPGDLAGDFFCGSGTLAVAAAKLGRKWLAADNEFLAVHTARKRILNLDSCPDFDVLSCGSEKKFLAANRIDVNARCRDNVIRVELTGYKQENKPQTAAWRDDVDYWAVDFSYGSGTGMKNPVFKNEWRSFRLKSGRGIEFVSEWRQFDAKLCKIAVKVADIYGNETIRIIDANNFRNNE